MWGFGDRGALGEGTGAVNHVPMPYSRHLFHLAVPELCTFMNSWYSGRYMFL